ncbi:MAG: NERD domain-containing protein [Actinomycetota bacterium]|nr:NERD domain-containing protein [Actinomycetota bacterium]
MTDLTVQRWRRYGKDRLYVNTADGQPVGWVDLLTGERILKRPKLREAFERAVASHLAEQRSEAAPSAAARPGESTAQPPAVAPASPPLGFHVEPFALRIDHTDLALRRAGQAARERAVQHRRAAPVRSLAARLLGVHTDERAWRIGADGERAVAKRLQRLPAPWTVLHAVPVGDRGADIDHVVIGPGGVFTVNSKHHPDARVWVGGNTFLVNGHHQPYVRNARHEAARAGRLLTTAVGFHVRAMGVIAVIGAHKGLVVTSQPDGVHVVARTQIASWLLDQPHLLNDEQVARLGRVARRSTTWR